MHGLKAQQAHSPGQRPGFPVDSVVTPCKGKSIQCWKLDIKLLPFQGVTNERALPQGVASLALGSVHHWAFSPSLLNPKLQSFDNREFKKVFFWHIKVKQCTSLIKGEG